LFPGIEAPWKESVGDAMHSISFVDYYRPFVTVGFYDEPFHKLKKLMFPILGEIKVFEKEHRAEKKRKKQQKKFLELHQRNMQREEDQNEDEDQNENENENENTKDIEDENQIENGLESGFEPKKKLNLSNADDVKEILTRFVESKVNRHDLNQSKLLNDSIAIEGNHDGGNDSTVLQKENVTMNGSIVVDDE